MEHQLPEQLKDLQIAKFFENRIARPSPKPITIKGPRNPREELIDKFRQRINAERVGTKYKPLSYVAVLQKVRHISDEGLYHFYKDCERGKSFGSTFFYKLRK